MQYIIFLTLYLRTKYITISKTKMKVVRLKLLKTSFFIKAMLASLGDFGTGIFCFSFVICVDDSGLIKLICGLELPWFNFRRNW